MLKRVFIFFIFYAFSLVVSPLYIAGDQIAYSKLYYDLAEIQFIDSFGMQLLYVSGAEPLPAMIAWIGSNLGIDKDVFYSFFNALLGYVVFIQIVKGTRSLSLTYVICFGFYFLVVFFAAERLKFSFLFLFSSFCFSGYFRLFLVSLSFLSHFQVLTIFPSLLLLELFGRGKFDFKILLKVFIPILVFLTFGFLQFKSYLFSKTEDSFNGLSIFDTYQLLILFLIVLFSSKRQFKFDFLFFVPFLPFIYFFSSSRVNIMAFIFFLFLIILERLRITPLVVALSLYFLIKSLLFIYNIKIYGDGFV